MHDRLRVIQTGRLKESLKVVCRWSRMALEALFCGHDVLLVRVICFLVIIIADSIRKPPRAPLSTALGALLGSLDGDVGWHHSVATGDLFLVTWGIDNPDRILFGGVLGGDVK
jgi:hypothetical protein